MNLQVVSPSLTTSPTGLPGNLLNFPAAPSNLVGRLLPSVLFWVLILTPTTPLTIHAKPVAPSAPTQVLERRVRHPTETGNQLRLWEAELKKDPSNLLLATRLAWRYLEKSRADSDPRYLSYAQSAIRFWWEQLQPPEEILLLRATIRQSNHQFHPALEDLRLILRANPANTQAWLTQATIHQVLGNYEEAKKCCAPLLRLSSELLAVTCAAGAASLQGQAQQSFTLLEQTIQRAPNAPIEERLWALTLLAEIAERVGKNEAAEKFYRQALALEKRDVYLLGAYADFLLDQNRANEAVSLLREETGADGLLLRLALAEKKFDRPGDSLPAHLAALQERFTASNLRGDSVHQREEARFLLHLLKDHRKALLLAVANWRIQREPADARILLEAALACHDLTKAQAVITWVKENKLEDVRINKLVERCLSHP